MNFLPVVQRELRVAARLPRTHYTRMLAALAGMVIVGYVGLVQREMGFGGGRMRFFGLTQLAGWVCLLLFVTPMMIRSGEPFQSFFILWALVGFGFDLLWWQHARRQLATRFRAEVACAAGHFPR